MFANALFIIDIITDHKTKLYINYIRYCVRKVIQKDLTYCLSHEYEVNAMYSKQKFNIGEKTPIWVCWFQGEKSMPDIVKMCYGNLQTKIDPEVAQVILIAEENFRDYIDLDESIYQKVKVGLLTYTNLSDLIRSNLLAVYGGLWIDSTVFVTRTIGSDILESEFYTQRTEIKYYVNRHVTKSRWASWLMYASDKSKLFKYVSFIMSHYFSRVEGGIIDYYLIDYVIEAVYDNHQSAKKTIDAVPLNNIEAFTLFKVFNQKYDKEFYDRIYKCTQFFKFTYKSECIEKDEYGNLTNYGYFIS